GAPGIALARAAALGVHDDAETRAELLRALAATRSLPDTERDHLCCGNLGRADVLLRAGEALGDAALRREARALGRRAVRRAERRGGEFSHTPPGSEGFHVSLMWGAAGVGYALLRLAHPELLPSVLLLE
ncbi:MAG TPA: lanthionine synthetase LanC family protein, partial [Longimicrobium sp.]|nr:lanthionine synthetase LanC family protein [Longimicrobium sp.]